MLKKFTLILASVAVLSACSSTKKGGLSGSENPLTAEFQRTAGDKIHFAYDSSELSAHSKEILSKQAAWLNAHPQVKATVEGHCDERGTREYNLALGERRAAAAHKFLVKHGGVSEARLNTVSYGKERPEVLGDKEEVWAKYRRDVTVIE